MSPVRAFDMAGIDPCHTHKETVRMIHIWVI